MKMLIGLHNIPGNEPTLRFAELVAQLAGASVLHRVSAGNLLQKAEEGAYDLVAVRWTGESRQDRIARQLVSSANASVLVIKGEPGALDKVLVCSGGRPVAEPVIDMGAHLAQAANAEVTLLHVTSTVPSMYTGLSAMEERIEGLLRSNTPEARHLRQSAQVFERHGIKATFELRRGVATAEIIRSVERQGHDLIVIGASDAARRLNRLLVGEVTMQVVEHATCSVLVARRARRPVN